MKNLIAHIRQYPYIWLLAIATRLIAALFSQGYGMHDDHFLVIESSASWVEGEDYNKWLPWTELNAGHPEGHSFTYVGLNYLYFGAMKAIGVENPKVLMVINRLIHGLFSLLIVYFGMRITQHLGSEKTTRQVGWLLAGLWVIPFLSVRNLVEITAIPWLMWGTWILVKNIRNEQFAFERLRPLIFAGLLFGIAASFRYQVAIYAVGFGVYFLWIRKFKWFTALTVGSIISFSFLQSIVDVPLWGYPFAEFWHYATYNMQEGTTYMANTNYLMYLWVLIGFLLVPLGILLFFGFIQSWRKWTFLFIPIALFFLFHTFYPNRQERFIFSILPMYIVLGMLGVELLEISSRWNRLWSKSWVVFWVINIPLLLFCSTMYSKKSRVEAMYSLYGKNIPSEICINDGLGQGKTSTLPRFYAGKWPMNQYACHTEEERESVMRDMPFVDLVFFFGKEDLDERIVYYQKRFPNMKKISSCEPSLVDRFIHWLNPVNKNEYIEVWSTGVRRWNVSNATKNC